MVGAMVVIPIAALAAPLPSPGDISAQAALAVPPADRPRHWDAGRALLGPAAGPGARQRWLARIALEWAASSAAGPSDRLFDLQPAAWVVLQAGGPDPLVEALLAAAPDATLCLVLDADAALAGKTSARPPPQLARCDGFEQEAQCTAAQVLLHLERGQVPVALIGQDRQLVRRVRALLERQQVPLVDETGWALSTTRAAAQVMALLRAAQPRAGTDALFDWLKSLPAWPGRANAASLVQQLERLCRRRGLSRAEQLDHAGLEAELAAFWSDARIELDRLRAGRQSVAAWLLCLRAALQGCGAWPSLEGDDAGRSVLQSLKLAPGAAAHDAWRDAAGSALLLAGEFVAWIDAVLEQANFTPAAPADADAGVVVTPLARAMLRPFAAVVCPGADDRHLGAAAPPHPLLSDGERQALRVPGRAERLQREAWAFAHVLDRPHVTLLRRHVDAGGEPLADSPLVQRLALDLADRGRQFAPWLDPRPRQVPGVLPVQRPLPSAATRLPARVSASAVEALRDCPYRFFARHVLSLREDDELEAQIEKRDYGSWLHAVLNAFHRARAAPDSGPAEQARLYAVAMAVQAELGLPDDEFLPFAASFARLAPRYIAWLHERDAAGAVWQDGERDCRIRPAELDGVEMHGVIDRIDRVQPGAALQLIDYKTGSASRLKSRLSDPLEDTQLAFYAALVAPETDAPVQALYLALDEANGVVAIPHPQVQRSARVLVHELGGELARLRAGAPLPALGEGDTCEHCEARGLCRRDHWQDGAAR